MLYRTNSVVTKGRLPDGTLFPMPITLDINEKLVGTRAPAPLDCVGRRRRSSMQCRHGTARRGRASAQLSSAAHNSNHFRSCARVSVSVCQYATLSATASPRLTLKDEEGNPLAILEVREMYRPDKAREGELVFGGDADHPAVAYLRDHTADVYVAGRLLGLQAPVHYDHADIRRADNRQRQ